MTNNEQLYQSILQQLNQIPPNFLPKIRQYSQQFPTTEQTIHYKKINHQIKSYFKNQPIEKAWIFGSFARQTATYKSDIDILVQFVQPNNIDLFDYIGMKQDLEDLTGFKIDLVEQGQEDERIKTNIEKDKILIYERKTN